MADVLRADIKKDQWLILENRKRCAEATRDKVHVLEITADFGTQQSRLLSINVFREGALAYYKHDLDWGPPAYEEEGHAPSEACGEKTGLWEWFRGLQQTLAFGAPKDVAREVEDNVRPRPGRRPGLGLIHNIRTGIPPERVPALIDAARNLSVY